MNKKMLIASSVGGVILVMLAVFGLIFGIGRKAQVIDTGTETFREYKRTNENAHKDIGERIEKSEQKITETREQFIGEVSAIKTQVTQINITLEKMEKKLP